MSSLNLSQTISDAKRDIERSYQNGEISIPQKAYQLLYEISRNVGNPFSGDLYMSLFLSYINGQTSYTVLSSQFGPTLSFIMKTIKDNLDNDNVLNRVEKEFHNDFIL